VHVDGDSRGSHGQGHITLDVQNLGHLHVKTPKSGGETLKYKAKEVHFNGPSEHKIDGTRHDMEMQIIHELVDSNDATKKHVPYAIVSVLFKRS
jgi:carbonic anhydrase